MLNLITDPWIPVILNDGTQAVIAPWQINAESGVQRLNAVRPDFNGALIQFLIGLFQCVIIPESPRKWRQLLQHPPTPEELKALFEPLKPAFNVQASQGPAFMQDFEELPAKEPTQVQWLLMDIYQPFFNKIDRIKRLCPICASMALFTLQINAPQGGAGHRTSLRGGGPLTTVIEGPTLWLTICANLLTQQWKYFDQAPDLSSAKVFPWLGPTRTSSNDRDTTPEQVHPLQMYWPMPRRIRLLFETEESHCDLCRQPTQQVVKEYITLKHGVKYESWKHPLTPYVEEQDNFYSIKGNIGKIAYQHWMGLVFQKSDADNKKMRQPAGCVQNYFNQYARHGSPFPNPYPRLWVFGYHITNNIIPVEWVDNRLPLYQINPELAEELSSHLRYLIDLANYIEKNTCTAVRKSLYGNIDESNKWRFSSQAGSYKDEGKILFANLKQRFWHQSENLFYEQLHEFQTISNFTSDNPDSKIIDIKKTWLQGLRKQSLQIFDQTTESKFLNIINTRARELAIARKELQLFNDGPKAYTLLDLPLEKPKHVEVQE
jgi:CRISPR system Cascade subunit CasA